MIIIRHFAKRAVLNRPDFFFALIFLVHRVMSVVLSNFVPSRAMRL